MKEGRQTVVVIGRAHHSGFLCKEKEKKTLEVCGLCVCYACINGPFLC